jgi:signal transduction histidine kinase
VRRRLLAAYLAFTVAILVGLEVPLATAYKQRERQTMLASLGRDGTALSALALDDLEHRDVASLADLANRYARQAGVGVTVFDSSGQVLVAEGRPPSNAIRTGLSRQVASALKGARPAGVLSRPGPDLLYVATPIGAGRSERGVTVIAAPTTALQNRVHRQWVWLGVLGLAVLVASGLLGLVLSRWLSRPLAQLQKAVEGLQAGDLGTRASIASGPPELVELAARFDDMAARLEEMVEGQRGFVADASHQLRTPLTALRLRLENLETTLPAHAKSDLEPAIAEAHRLSRLVDGLLALARVEGSRPDRRTIDVRAVVADRRQAWAPLAEERDVDLQTRLDGAATAYAVPGFLEQVLDNLVANALEATPYGTTVTLGVTQRPPWVEVRVVDEGPGLAEAERARAFDRFWRRERSGQPGGSGLGLAIVRQLVRSSGGEVELREAPGGGLEAVVRLRRAPDGGTADARARGGDTAA